MSGRRHGNPAASVRWTRRALFHGPIQTCVVCFFPRHDAPEVEWAEEVRP